MFGVFGWYLSVFHLQEPNRQMQDTYGKNFHQVPSKSVVMAPSYGQKTDFLPQEGGGGSDRVATPLSINPVSYTHLTLPTKA